VQAVTRYEATEPDELLLEESDVINVLRKISDGKSQLTRHDRDDMLTIEAK